MNILMVCTGNICRSPMAQGLLEDALPPQLKAVLSVASAGTHAQNGLPAETHAVDVMSALHVDISAHRSRRLDLEMIQAADQVLVMEPFHSEFIVTHWPFAYTKVHLLGKFSSRKTITEIPDPYGGEMADYRASAELIRGCLNALIGHLHQMLD